MLEFILEMQVIDQFWIIGSVSHARALILSKMVLLVSNNTVYKFWHNLCGGSIFGASALYFRFETYYKIDIKQLFSSNIQKRIYECCHVRVILCITF